ncbi:pentatricopeptide repeat-containing protein At3g02490, mitochondrial-like [Tasmannia lanceolata]|uniref:pentatricopeptide repeat-containing protein At3g02490, mitochondrial-like n=1 Tax=Tasmannia lanceolata TaxID=3420 RepID=UPI004063DAEE
MRNPWKLLLVRSFSRSTVRSPGIDSLYNQVTKLGSQNARFSHSFCPRNSQNIGFPFSLNAKMGNHINRYFSSELVLEQKDPDHVLFHDIFSKTSSFDDVKNAFESLNLPLDHETVLLVLRNLDGSPKVAQRFFDWVLETDDGKLSSKSYNLMLGFLGGKDHVKEFWDLFVVMKKKGYGISKYTHNKVSESFSEEGMVSDLDRLKEVFTLRSMEDSTERLCSMVCKIIREGEWGEEIQKKLEDLDVVLSSNLILMVLPRLDVCPMKALMFFRWVEENRSLKHDAKTYNAMARLLVREDCIGEFWAAVNEMMNARLEMEMSTYIMASGWFYKRKMVKEAVDLYEFMMEGSDKPPVQDCLFLLRKIVSCKETDMDLFSRVISIFAAGGNILTKSTFDGVLKSLTGAGKLGECDGILKAMEKGGFVANSSVHSQVVLGLCKAESLDEACKFVDGCNSGIKPWESLIQGLCGATAVDMASSWFQKMVDRESAAKVGCAFEVLVKRFCHQDRPQDACKILSEMVDGKQLQPWHTTYKILIEKLLGEGFLKEALSLLGLMKKDGFPPFIDPFIVYISKSGSEDDAMSFLKAMTVKRFPSTTVFLRIFEAILRAGRHNVAHNLLSKCPGYIRGHADVLNLFCSMKPKEAAAAVA